MSRPLMSPVPDVAPEHAGGDNFGRRKPRDRTFQSARPDSVSQLFATYFERLGPHCHKGQREESPMHGAANWLDLAEKYRTLADWMRNLAARQAMLEISAEHEAAAEAAVRAESASLFMGFPRRSW